MLLAAPQAGRRCHAGRIIPGTRGHVHVPRVLGDRRVLAVTLSSMAASWFCVRTRCFQGTGTEMLLVRGRDLCQLLSRGSVIEAARVCECAREKELTMATRD